MEHTYSRDLVIWWVHKQICSMLHGHCKQGTTITTKHRRLSEWIAGRYPLPALSLIVVAAIPIAIALRWTAIAFPISSSEYFVRAVWIDDRFAVVQFVFPPLRSGIWRSYESIVRGYLIDCETGRRTELAGDISGSEYQSLLPWIAPDGTILRLAENEASWKLQRIDPRTLESRTDHVGWVEPVLVGNRYLITQTWDASENEGLLRSRDVLDDEMRASNYLFRSYRSKPIPVEGASAFYIEFSDPFAELSEEEIRLLLEEVPSLSPLRNRDNLQPQPLPAFQDNNSMLLLYAHDAQGPKLVTSFPVVGESGYPTVQASGGCIATLRIDATVIDVRNARTGELLHSVPVTANMLPADFRPDWSLDGRTLTVFDTTEIPVQTIDMTNGQVFQSDHTLRRTVYDQTEDHYLTAADADWNDPADWPVDMQVRDRKSGRIVSSVNIDGGWVAPEFSTSGSLVKCVDSKGNPVFANAATGKVLRRVTQPQWILAISVATGIAIILWVVQFASYCRKANASAIVCPVVITAIALCFCLCRLRLSGHPQLFDRLAWQVVFSIAISWGLAISLWVVQSRIRWTYRLAAGCSLFVVYNFLSSLLMDEWESVATFVYSALAALLLLIWSILIRCFSHVEVAPNSMRPSRAGGVFSIRSLFVWTTVTATTVCWGIQFDWSFLTRFMTTYRLVPLSIDCSLSLLVAITTWWGFHRLRWRALAIPFSLAFAIFVRAFLFSGGIAYIQSHDAWWYWAFQDEVWYACFKFAPLAVIMAISIACPRRFGTDEVRAESERHLPVSRAQ